MIDVREIKLSMRYPESRQEDITDAFTRGYTGAVEIGNKAIKKLEAENAKLRELCKELYPFVGSTCPDECKHREECEGEGNRGTDGFPLVCVAYNRYFEDMRELGIEVES